MSLRQTPITALASNLQGLCNAAGGPDGFLLSSVFNTYSSINQLSFLPGYLSSVWSELYLGSTIYVSTLISPYAVIIGPGNTVGGIYTLTAGISNTNFGSNAFVGGCNSYGIGANVMAYGTGAQATSTNTAAFGAGTLATVPNSIAFGFSSITIAGSNQHTEGMSNVADGTASHAEGISTLVYSDFCHTEGYDTQIWNATNSHAEGVDSMISSGTACHVEGLSTFVFGGLASHAEGANTVADVGVAHAEGEQTIALASTAHTEGYLTIASTFFSSVIGFGTLPVAASNAHVEGFSNLLFMPNNHMEGLSSINFGWVNHINGLANVNQAQFNHIQGFSNNIISPIINNNSTFVKSFSSLFSLRTAGNLAFGYDYSVFNHIHGGMNIISSPSYACHVEGYDHVVCATTLHIEGAFNSSIYGLIADVNNRSNNVAAGECMHFEGSNNSSRTPTSYSHMEGVSNLLSAASGGAWHLGGFGHSHIGSLVTSTWSLHTEGSNTGQVIGGNQSYPTVHKEGVNNGTGLYASNTSVVGEQNTAGYRGHVGGFCNDTNTTLVGYVYGKQNRIYNRFGANNTNTCVFGLSNFTESGGNGRCGTLIGNYLKQSNIGELIYGNTAFFHSTTASKLIRASAQTFYINLMARTSSATRAYNNFIYSGIGTNYLGTLASNIVSSIIFNTNTNENLISYPASNQIAYINVVDLKLTGYQSRRTDSSGGLGFYSGNYSFAVYRNNTSASNLCLYDMVSKSTITTNTAAVIPISTTIKPIIETNRLLNTPNINLEVFARNTTATVPQQGFYGLKINANGTVLTNWTAQLEISQVIRP